MARHAIFSRAAFQVRSRLRRLWPSSELPGVSVLLVTWNRAEFLDLALRALADTLPAEHEVLIWDNASRDHTPDVIQRWRDSRLKLRVWRGRKNIGTSAYAMLALYARRALIMGIDEDVVLLPRDWYVQAMKAFEEFPELGYVALDVLQDEFTHGGKPCVEHYTSETRHGITVEFGPVGAWASLTPREFYFRTAGFPFRPHKPSFLQDAFYRLHVERGGKRWGILKDVKVYHAAGPLWNIAMGYASLMRTKSAAAGAPTVNYWNYPPLGEQPPERSLIERYRHEIFNHADV